MWACAWGRGLYVCDVVSVSVVVVVVVVVVC